MNVSILDFIGAKDDGGGGDNWSCKTCKAPNHHHQQTNIQFFYRMECPSCHRTNSDRALQVLRNNKRRGNYHSRSPALYQWMQQQQVLHGLQHHWPRHQLCHPKPQKQQQPWCKPLATVNCNTLLLTPQSPTCTSLRWGVNTKYGIALWGYAISGEGFGPRTT